MLGIAGTLAILLFVALGAAVIAGGPSSEDEAGTFTPVDRDGPSPAAPSWCPAVAGLDGPETVGHAMVATGLEDALGPADQCLYEGGIVVAAMWPGRTVDDLEAAALDSDRFEGNDGEYAYTYYDGETLLGCATVELDTAVYGACGSLYGDDHQLLVDLHQAIKDEVG